MEGWYVWVVCGHLLKLRNTSRLISYPGSLNELVDCRQKVIYNKNVTNAVRPQTNRGQYQYAVALYKRRVF